jgi:flagellar basal-body rod modification protein FlgD
MNIDPTTRTTTATPTTTTGGALTGSKDEFLKLFMAQLQHQDPLDPKSGADMVAQLAQFSSVEQAQQTNQHLTDLAAAQTSTSSASLANLVGRDCNATAADFQLDRGGAVPALQITSTTALNGATAVITNADGKELRRIAVPGGFTSSQLTWDGKDASGAQVPPGGYHLTIEPGTTTGTISSQWHGRVDAVELSSGNAQLRMGGVLLTPADVRTIGMATPAPTSTTP